MQAFIKKIVSIFVLVLAFGVSSIQAFAQYPTTLLTGPVPVAYGSAEPTGLTTINGVPHYIHTIYLYLTSGQWALYHDNGFCGTGGVTTQYYGYYAQAQNGENSYSSPWNNSAYAGQTITMQIIRPISQRYESINLMTLATVYEVYSGGCADWRNDLVVESRNFSVYLPGGPSGTEFYSSITSPNPAGVNQEITLSIKSTSKKSEAISSKLQNFSIEENFSNKKTVKVFNALNEEVTSTSLLQDGNAVISTNGLKAGTYFYRVIDEMSGKPITSGKFVIAN